MSMTETYQNGWSIHLTTHSQKYLFSAYSVQQLLNRQMPSFLTEDELAAILSSGRDILAEQLPKNTDPDYDTVASMLPPPNHATFCFLSSISGWGGVIVDAYGNIFPQAESRIDTAAPLFSPARLDDKLSRHLPLQQLLSDQYPLLFNVFTDGTGVLELLYFVEPFEPDQTPAVWIRAKRYPLAQPDLYRTAYHLLTRLSDQLQTVDEALFSEALEETILFWVRFREEGTQLKIPQKELQNLFHGSFLAAAETFSGDHAHYGHGFYADNDNDNFPPNYIWFIGAACLLGRALYAARIVDHLLTYVVNHNGRIVYRQGEQAVYGVSAAEYGQLLFLLNRYHKLLNAANWPETHVDKLTAIGNQLLSCCLPCDEADGRLLIKMCAEADTNTRVHVYLSNNFWGIRGLYALSELLALHSCHEAACRFRTMASMLRENIDVVIKKYTEMTRFGPLVPFRLGYTARPATLSFCQDSFDPLSEEEWNIYRTPSYMRDLGRDELDVTENSYANYRYYPEMLSAMLLDTSVTDALVHMRESIGGECLGMTRFLGHLDDWPVLNYASFLLESGRIEKYLLLLYSHTTHHGSPSLLCYYEQIAVGGKVLNPDCIPSLLTSAVMLGWMFAYETVENKQLQLLKAIPQSWFNDSFSIEKLSYSCGSIDISWDHNTLTLHFSEPTDSPSELFFRNKSTLSLSDFRQGNDHILSLSGNRLTLKSGLTTAVFEFV